MEIILIMFILNIIINKLIIMHIVMVIEVKMFNFQIMQKLIIMHIIMIIELFYLN